MNNKIPEFSLLPASRKDRLTALAVFFGLTGAYIFSIIFINLVFG